MQSHPHANDMITFPNESQSGTQQATSSSQLLVECSGSCKRRVALETVELARDGHSKAVWNCSSCRKIKNKLIEISWYNLVCGHCTDTHGKTCLIQTCASNCPTKQALEKKKPVTSKVDRTFIRARSLIEPLMHRELVERLNVIKTAWILGKNGVPQPWFSFCGKAICDTPGWLSRCLGSAPKCTTKQSTT